MTTRRITVKGFRDFVKYFESLDESSKIKMKLRAVIDEMRMDLNRGDLIKHKPYPVKYRRTHAVTNLFVYNIPENRRLIYTIKGMEIGKVYQLLEVLTHKQYLVTLNYHTS